MKRIQEKVKDLIDVRPYEVLQDFISDPAQTLSIYQFTDITSDLMAQWLDHVASVEKGNGSAKALAGYRGVGKSHFLATLGAIISQPELRSRITDSHVASSAQRLKRRRHPVAYVRRGIFDRFVDELRAAIAKALNIDVTHIDSLAELLNLAAQTADDMPFVLMIDTAFERSSRVSRDDGPILSEIAEIAKDLNIFVGVALDDDIAGADGANASITRTYAIDYLDQEHLYKIVNTYIFPKHRQTLPMLHDIYNEFRRMLPSFRWSEQRFISLYPLHPVTLEIAPYVRLYAQDFALLSFTATAGTRIMGRPANSLIALDEVFDSVEPSLRKVADLDDAFAAYDKLNNEVVAQIPIMQRMQAKLILKGLMLLSLDGYGTTVGEISAAMLIFNEAAPEKSTEEVRSLLEMFITALPERLERFAEEGRETRYSIRISNKDYLNNALTEAVFGITKAVIPKILRRVGRDRFPEWILPGETENQRGDTTECHVTWRGGLRRGKVIWDLEPESSAVSEKQESAEIYDWEVRITPFDVAETTEETDASRIYWRPAPLREDEADTILRYFVLSTNQTLREEYGELWHAAGHTHTVNVEKIWHRLFIEDAKFIIDGSEYSVSEDAAMSLNLSEFLSNMLQPLFEVRYPNHPVFPETLQMNDVAALVKDFFSGAKQTSPEMQRLAENFALPLDLVVERGSEFVSESEENILKLSPVQEVLSLIESEKGGAVSLKTVSSRLRQIPFGLMRESQYLILSALVAKRQLEFVTSKGDRINRRSLDLNIIWDDIVGIAKPATLDYSVKRLTQWAQLITGDETLRSIENREDQEALTNAFSAWMKDWEQKNILKRFDELPDEIFNTEIWRISVALQKTFGSAANALREFLNGNIAVEESLLRIADAFSDSENVFENCRNDLVVLQNFVDTIDKRREISIYLAVCDATDEPEIEKLRERLSDAVDGIGFDPDVERRSELETLWADFRQKFGEHFAVNHDAVMKSHALQEKYDEIRKGDEWWEFENLSAIPAFPKTHWTELNSFRRRFRELDCRFDVRELLKTHPFCACSFTLSKSEDWEALPATFFDRLNGGRTAYHDMLRKLNSILLPAIEETARKYSSPEFRTAAEKLSEFLNGKDETTTLDTFQIAILREVFDSLPEIVLTGINTALESKSFDQAKFWNHTLNELNV